MYLKWVEFEVPCMEILRDLSDVATSYLTLRRVRYDTLRLLVELSLGYLVIDSYLKSGCNQQSIWGYSAFAPILQLLLEHQ